jgi:hypothetical protein
MGTAEGQVLFFVAWTEREEDVRIISPGRQPFADGGYVHRD